MWKREAEHLIWQTPRSFRRFFSFKSDTFQIRVVKFSAAADLTKLKSGLLLRLRGYLKKIKMADLLISVCLSSGQMCGQSKQQQINLANAAAAASDL